MLSIPMGGVDVVLGVQWLKSLGTISFNFKEIFMKFSAKGKEVELWGIAGKLGKTIRSNDMKKILKKEQRGVMAQLCSLDVSTSKSSISLDPKRSWIIIPIYLRLPKVSHLFVIMIMLFT